MASADFSRQALLHFFRKESTFSLKVTNYDDWWIHSFSVKELSSNSYVLVPKIDNKKVSYKDWFNAMVASNQLKCTISENISSVPRTIKMEMTVGDVFETIYIVPQIRNPTKVSERCGPNRQECDFSSLD